MPDVAFEPRLLHGLDMIQVDGGFVLEALSDADDHLARGSVDRRCHRGHHHGVEEADHLLSAEHDHRPLLVGRGEPVPPDLAAAHYSGHEPSSSQPANSGPSPPAGRYACRYASAIRFDRERRRYSAVARRRTADRPTRRTSPSASNCLSSFSSNITCIGFMWILYQHTAPRAPPLASKGCERSGIAARLRCAEPRQRVLASLGPHSREASGGSGGRAASAPQLKRRSAALVETLSVAGVRRAARGSPAAG